MAHSVYIQPFSRQSAAHTHTDIKKDTHRKWFYIQSVRQQADDIIQLVVLWTTEIGSFVGSWHTETLS